MLILAYIGPGAGLSLVGAIVGLLASIGFSLLMIVAHPIRKMLKKRTGSEHPAHEPAAKQAAARNVVTH